MSNQDKSDHWRLLASEIGAESCPEPEATEPPPTDEPAGPVAEDSQATSATKPERPQRSSRPPRPRANWMELAEQLGVAVPETPEVSSEASAAKANRPTATAPEEPNMAVEPPEWLDHGSELETLDEVVFPVSAPRAAVPRGEDEAAEAAESKLPRKRKKRRRRGRESKSAAEPAVRDEMDEDAETELAHPEIAEADDKEPADEGERAAESGGKASRRKRRGRGGRRRSTGAGKASDDAIKKRDEDDLDETARETRKRVSGGRLLEDEDEDDEEDGATRKAPGFAHRGIPSWEEAVGVVIGINLESRAKRGPSEGSSRPRGGRGRRGRDKGKGPSK